MTGLPMAPLSEAEMVAHLDKVVGSDTVDDAWQHHLGAMAAYGFDRLLYGFTRFRSDDSLGDPLDWIVLTSHSDSYIRTFLHEGLYFDAPMLHWALRNDGACSWARLWEPGGLTPAEARVAEFNLKAGVSAGYTISFRSASPRTKGAIALTARAGLCQDEVDRLWAEHGDRIMLLNNVLHLKLLSLPHAGARRLTRRQIEVLQWIGDGKTIQDVAVLLGLRPATVEKHLRLARHALGVETTAQAVLKAALSNQMFRSNE